MQLELHNKNINGTNVGMIRNILCDITATNSLSNLSRKICLKKPAQDEITLLSIYQNDRTTTLLK